MADDATFPAAVDAYLADPGRQTADDPAVTDCADWCCLKGCPAPLECRCDPPAAWCSCGSRPVATMRVELERLRPLAAMSSTCSCPTSPEAFEGPQPDCPVHGAVRAFNEACDEIERLKGALLTISQHVGVEAWDDLSDLDDVTSAIRGAWSGLAQEAGSWRALAEGAQDRVDGLDVTVCGVDQPGERDSAEAEIADLRADLATQRERVRALVKVATSERFGQLAAVGLLERAEEILAQCGRTVRG